ncbi:MAG: UvrD-helicase domain-containing protein [Chloroflexi bacterium]|nr:UvrD-helicase domain-containing protein [Chloroflexota bacterium]
MSSILSLIPLDPTQRAAVTQRDADIVVTAGAGSGKTRTLVARFLALLDDGAPLRSLIAITFTDKAAREMRTRIRGYLASPPTPSLPLPPLLGLNFSPGEGGGGWGERGEVETARIGTIHSLCAAILRAHPAEAGIDPEFQVLDENTSAALYAEAVETALAWTANDADASVLFSLLKENALRELLGALVAKRLDAQATLDAVADPRATWEAALTNAVAQYTAQPTVAGAIATLRELRDSGQLERVAGNKLAPQIVALLERWARLAGSSDWDLKLRELFALRRENLSGRVGDKGAAKDAVQVLREHYDETLDPWLGGQGADDALPRWALDERAADTLPQLRRAFEAAVRAYDALKADRRALDFDDLEAQTVALLENNADVRARWQSETRAVLVDEFQDTNDRQRRIAYALSGFGFPTSNFQLLPQTPRDRGATSKLFVVGDGKQSIYRFRGGDVTVLRRVQADVAAQGGAAFDLDLTYRAHEPLVIQLNALLEPILGATDDPARPYAIPFSPLRAHRLAPRDGIREPFVEFCLGLGEDAEQGRTAAAHALAARLARVRDDERVAWGEIALLFRASTHFVAFEAAFERAGIPFVTVAGKGLYERPEVRDLLNALAALADPTDDLALAGVLRSPAFGLSDAALYLLRRDGEVKRSFWSALHGDLSALAPDDAARAVRAREILTQITRLAGRASVAATLKAFLDATDYQAILSHAPGGERPRRNVAKLLADAHASGLVGLTEFLEYVRTLREVEARTGEAPIEAGESVQLMTVHKAKGLEFPVVVIADAAHAPRSTHGFWLDPELGPVFSISTATERSVIDRLARRRDQDQADAEERRLLYVAATRAKDKLIVCGHCKRKTNGTLTLGGWLGLLGEITKLNEVVIPDGPETNGNWGLVIGNCGVEIASKLDDGRTELAAQGAEALAPITTFQLPSTPQAPPLLSPLVSPPRESADDKVRAREGEPPRRVWRVVPTAARPQGPAWVVGQLAHEALRRWRFPDKSEFEVFLHPHAIAAGLTDQMEIAATVGEVRRLLERFQSHALFAEMDAAERYHEVPYAFEREGCVENGVIDVLYRLGDNWRVVDFKTDEIRDEPTLNEKIYKYRAQVACYADAVRVLAGASPQAQLCFLNVRGEVRVAGV